MENKIELVGLLDHERIREFWMRQDICISLSDYEGHSIMQTEAMAAGVVPVVTRTSGTEDDICEGDNGFIVEIGDVDQMAQCIGVLYQNQNVLEEMKMSAMAAVRRRQEKAEGQQEMWLHLFEKYKRMA